MSTSFDWVRGFALDFDLRSGRSQGAAATVRRLSQMRGMYLDGEAHEQMIGAGDPAVYEFYELGAPEHPGDLAFGSSIVYPGKVGREYFMTKGHYHSVLDTAEVYYCLSGRGALLTESPEGESALHPLLPGGAVYVPRRHAHRSINTGGEPLVFFYVFRADAGHDYGSIETRGFRKLLVEQDGQAVLIDNPGWN